MSLIAWAVSLALGASALAQDVPQVPAPSGLADQPAPAPPAAPTPPVPRTLSPVIWSEDADIVQRFAIDNAVARRMVNRCLLKLTSASDIGTAWRRLGITPSDVVGVKIATMGGPLMSSHRAVVQAICDGLIAAGVPTTRIIVWDKSASDMRTAGYEPQPPSDSHVGIAAVFPGTGYDPDAIYKNGILGTLIWGDADFSYGSNADLTLAASNAVRGRSGYGASDGVGDNFSSTDYLLNSGAPLTSNKSHFARLVTTICTKIVNVPVLTDNPYVGINGCMATLALGSVDNNRRLQGDPTYGDPAISEILANPILRRKVVVHIMDAMIAQYAGGPRFNPVYTKQIGAVYVSRDPVAIDAITLQRLERFRTESNSGRLDPIGKAAVHIHGGADANLGTDDASRIQLVRVEP
ncbi:MAG TPA: DUF362 domain-containing protein [Candidatus Methylacidiphilales bacterium]|nr:DUF362 domain-containing protein [Candidatus Methylacidiphilales bacterium]